MLTRLIALVLATSALGSALAQTAAEQLADVQLETAKVNLELNRANLNAALRTAATGTTATFATANSDKSVEAAKLRREVYRSLAERLAKAVDAQGDPQPLIQFGTQQPDISAWLGFQDNLADLTDAFTKAEEAAKVFSSKPTLAFPGTVLIPALTALSLLRTESVITGSSLKADDVEFAGLIHAALRNKPSLDSFKFETNGADVANNLLGGLVKRQDDLKKRAATAKPVIDALDLKAKLGGAGYEETPQDKNKRIAAEAINTAIKDYAALRKMLLSSTNGVTNSIIIQHQRELANPHGRTILYVLRHDANLTIVTRKNFLSGLGSTPARLSASATVDYVLVGNKTGESPNGATPSRASITCDIAKVPFDTLSKAGPVIYPKNVVPTCIP